MHRESTVKSITASLLWMFFVACSENPTFIDENTNQITPSEINQNRPTVESECDPDDLLENEVECADFANAPDLDRKIAELFKEPSPPLKTPAAGTSTSVSSSPGNSSSTNPSQNALPTSVNFNGFCAEASTIKSMENAGLKSLLEEACQNGSPTTVFTVDLIAKAYRGDGQLKFHTIRSLSSDNRNQTSMRVAFAFALPISAKEYFDRITPLNLEAAGLQEILESAGGSATVSIKQNFSNDGLHHERGVLATQKLIKPVALSPDYSIQVTVQSETRYDQHSLTAPTGYLNTSRIEQAISGTKAHDSLTAIIQQGDQAYYIQFWHIVSPNSGRPGIAEPEMARSVVTSANALYKRILRQSRE